MASKLNVNLTDLQSLVVSPTLLSRSDTQSTRLDGHDSSLNSIFSTAVKTTGATFTGDVTVEGSFTVTGTYADVKNLDVSDNLIGLNKGLTTRSATRDSGILIERGDASNVFMGFDESTQKFTMGTTTSLASHAGNMENFAVSTLLANLEGKIVSGDVSGGSLDVSFGTLTTSAAQKKAIVEGVGASLNLSSTDLSVNNLAAIDLSVNSLTIASFAPNAINIAAGTLTTSTAQKKAIVEGVGATSLDLSGTDLLVNKIDASNGTVDVSFGTLTTSTAQNLAIFKSGVAANDADLDIGTFSLTAKTLVSDVATGTAPLTVTSTDKVNNLHASQVTGPVDGVVGGNTPAAGTFTSLAAQGVTVNSLIVNKAQKLETNAVDISDGGSAFTDNDVRVRVGAVDMDDLTGATHRSFKNIYIDV